MVMPAGPTPPAPPAPKMPGNPAGGPSGPGAPLPATAGIGAGNEAAADGLVTAIIPTLHKALSAYQPGSKKYQGVLNAIKALTPSFAKENQQSLVPSALLQMSQMAKQPGPMTGAAPPPLAAAPMEPEGGMPV